jgi:pyruvate kinase
MERRAKIMATIGPASESAEVIHRLLEAGVNIVRLNLSHGNHETHGAVVERVRTAARDLGLHVPIVFDLMGPRYRLGKLPEGGLEVKDGDLVHLGEKADEVELPVDAPGLLEYLQPGERILIDNGLVELEVESKATGVITARVLHGGVVSTRKGINLPDSSLPFQVSKKDRDDIAFAVQCGIDYLGVSFVGSAEHLERLRGVVEGVGGEIPLVAKLERAAAMEHLDAIVEAADAVMVARGDLGVEVPLDQVPVMQKKIIAAGRKAGRPVIVATQMLESMIEHPRPTRAEVSDVANAVLDGADAVMLSGETAVGHFPVDTVKTMNRIIHQAETFHEGATDHHVRPFDVARDIGRDIIDRRDALDIANAISIAAVQAGELLKVRQIVAFSQGGFTGRLIARYRPSVPVLVFTPEEEVARRLQLLWGVRPVVLQDSFNHHDQVVKAVDRCLLDEGLAQVGEVIILLMGDPIPERPRTNLMRIHRVRPRRN